TLRNWRSATSRPEPTQRSMWSPARQRFTLRQTVSTMEKADSITLVLARVRRNCAGTRKRCTVSVSSMPSSKVLAGENPGGIARTDHREWYRELFEPCVVSGLIPASALAGYRNDAVYLRNSRYVPPRWEAVRDAMPALFDLIEAEPEPSVRAVLGHWLFGYIHPYADGNGRMARFLMNVLLASGGYPWTVVRVEDRTEYLKALDRASIEVDARPFASFIAERVRWSLKKTKRSVR